MDHKTMVLEAENLSRSLLSHLAYYNQYIIINRENIAGLAYIYLRIFKAILEEANKLDLYNQDLKEALLAIDEVALLDRPGDFKEIPCYEYSPEKQEKILGLEASLREPIIDLGCGRRAGLVKYLRGSHKKVIGLDRYPFKEDYLLDRSWFDHEFKEGTYGTIISHMAFSNHFTRENLKLEGEHIAYAEKYMEILRSLQVGGSFYYTPGLKFIEDLLPREVYRVESWPISQGYLAQGQEKDFFRVRITRLL